jgi:hypothetical protein
MRVMGNGSRSGIVPHVSRYRIGFVLAAALLGACAPSEQETDYQARKALLLRQNQGIRELIQEAERGSLVPPDRFLVGIDESLVQDLFESQLPLERPVGKRFVMRLERAAVTLQDKFGIITIEGNLHRPETPDRRTAVRIHGGLGKVKIDPRTDMLDVDIAIDRVELLEVGLLEGVLGRGGKALLAEQSLPRIQEAIPHLQVPVVLGQTIRVPAVRSEGFQLDSLVVPLNLSVERVIAVGGKLWVTIDASVGSVQGAEKGVGVSIRKKPRKAKTT